MLQTQTSMRRASAAAATVGLTAGTVVVAIAARAPLSRSTPIDASAATTPVTALALVVAGAGILALAGLATLAWAGRRRKDDPPEHASPPPELPWTVKLVVTVLPFALAAAVIGAALSGTRTQRNGPGLGLGLASGAGRASLAPAAGTGKTGFVLPAWLPWTVLGIVAAAAIAAGAIVLVRGHSRPAPEPSEPNATGAAVAAAIGALEGDADPRRAVIAAYEAMQRTLAAHGLVRAGSEAPREFLRRVLLANRATEREATTLTGLFEEARFSSHPIPDRVRGRALSALRSLQARLGGRPRE